jgi:hypothetical protein
MDRSLASSCLSYGAMEQNGTRASVTECHCCPERGKTQSAMHCACCIPHPQTGTWSCQGPPPVSRRGQCLRPRPRLQNTQTRAIAPRAPCVHVLPKPSSIPRAQQNAVQGKHGSTERHPCPAPRAPSMQEMMQYNARMASLAGWHTEEVGRVHALRVHEPHALVERHRLGRVAQIHRAAIDKEEKPGGVLGEGLAISTKTPSNICAAGATFRMSVLRCPHFGD